MKKFFWIVVFFANVSFLNAQNLSAYNLSFNELPNRWDEALPLGNGMLGALVWQNGENLRFSLDRADLWDERQALDLSRFNFKWVENQVATNQYDTVQKLGDAPYEALPYPTKIPAAALEFNIAALGKVKSAILDIKKAQIKVIWQDGAILEAFVDASQPFGAFRITGISSDIIPKMMVPDYNKSSKRSGKNVVSGQGLAKLGYAKGIVHQDAHHITYIQQGSNGFHYEVGVSWTQKGDILEGIWSIASYAAKDKRNNVAEKICNEKLLQGYAQLLLPHERWWKNFWSKSSVSVPDTLLQKQYYLEMYKLGCVSRKDAPPITLQAIWTADNGSLPPWKGDIHNDLNTQLSYWPTYSSNHLQEAASFTDWLWKVRKENEAYTKEYFQVDGLNVPGVATLSGKPMGGWIQYSLSPTVSAWLAQNFYWQWKYSMDRSFLKKRAYPYIHDVATFLSNITEMKDGMRILPLSSSPEFHDNSINAWYTKGNTNYDLALMRFAFGAAAEVAKDMGRNKEAKQWMKERSQLPYFSIDSTGLRIAPREARNVSHRHHSNLIAIYPLSLLNPENASDKAIIDSSLRWLQHTGTRAWCGYSFSWAASLYARAKDGDNAAKELHIFASNFCSPNSFHLNGDQKGGQYSGYTYRPFTLEGNFAFAQGIQEMLLQSNSGTIEVFPAVPEKWKDVSFHDLRAEGAFLVSAQKSNGVIKSIKIAAEQGGTATVKLPFKHWAFAEQNGVISKKIDNNAIKISFRKGGEIQLVDNEK